MATETITYSDKLDGWTSFHTYEPDMLCKLNNRLFSIKNGQLYLHNDESNPVKNNFYEEQVTSKISTVINDNNSEDKIFKTLVLEGNDSWDVNIETNLTNGSLSKDEFNLRDSRYFTHTRGNENSLDFHGNSIQGIGNLLSYNSGELTFDYISEFINIGDEIYQNINSLNTLIGNVSGIYDNIIEINPIISIPVDGGFCFASKNKRVEGSPIRGYYAQLELTNNSNKHVELFAIESNIIKSYV